MRRIFKYQLDAAGNTTLNVRRTSKVVRVAEQHGHTTLWIEDDHNDHGEHRTFCTVGTGWAIEDGWKHIGSFQGTDLNRFVWHVYEVMP